MVVVAVEGLSRVSGSGSSSSDSVHRESKPCHCIFNVGYTVHTVAEER